MLMTQEFIELALSVETVFIKTEEKNKKKTKLPNRLNRHQLSHTGLKLFPGVCYRLIVTPDKSLLDLRAPCEC